MQTKERFIDRGFTLLEVLVVVVILGLLAAYVGPRYFGQLGKAESKSAQTQINAFGKALDTYRLDTGSYPNTAQGLIALYQKPAQINNWFGPYLDKPPPKDPWGKAYEYRSPGQHGEYDLFTWGKDASPGGEAENADITSWVSVGDPQ